MTRFYFLKKSEKDTWLPILFDLFYENMQYVAESDKSYNDEKNWWIPTISEALERDPRNIIMFDVDGEFAGFFMYYIREKTIVAEELQIVKKHQRTRLLYRLCKHLIEALGDDAEYIEAYAHRQNLNSQKLMKYLMMKEREDLADPSFVGFCGRVELAKRRIK